MIQQPFPSFRKHVIKPKKSPLKQKYQTIDVIRPHSKLNSSRHTKKPLFHLPPLQQPKNDDQFIRLRNQIFHTVKKLQDKIFVPHNASKKKNLQLIKRKRGSEFKIQRASRSFSMQQEERQKGFRKSREISLDQKMNSTTMSMMGNQKNTIKACTLEQASLYG